MSHCHDGSCSTGSKKHGSGCGCSSSKCSCGSGCGCGCGCSDCSCGKKECHEGDFAHELLEMADDAWMCLLKDKIKQKIEVLSGNHLEELADIVATANHKKWIDKMAASDASDDYEDRVADFFSRNA